jgi:transcriptional regulator with PAS, ATPase and Fis domain
LNLREGKEEAALERIRESRNLPAALEEVERQMIAEALEKNSGVQTKAAGDLGISERVLRYKIKKYKIAE